MFAVPEWDTTEDWGEVNSKPSLGTKRKRNQNDPEPKAKAKRSTAESTTPNKSTSDRADQISANSKQTKKSDKNPISKPLSETSVPKTLQKPTPSKKQQKSTKKSEPELESDSSENEIAKESSEEETAIPKFLQNPMGNKNQSEEKSPRAAQTKNEKKTQKKKKTLPEPEPESIEQPTKKSSKLDEMKQRLKSGQFRYLNEQLYTSDSQTAFEMFQDDSSLFDAVGNIFPNLN
jgi:glucan-binding YG repeat protein